MKYYVKNGTIFNLENADESFTEISEVEAMRLIKPSEFHEWSGTEWLDPRTEEEKLAYKRSQYPKLTRYQFMRGMLEYGYEAADIESQILLIEDERTRKLTMIGFKDAGNFVRTDPSIDVVRDMLGKTDLDIDEFWELCTKFQCRINANS